MSSVHKVLKYGQRLLDDVRGKSAMFIGMRILEPARRFLRRRPHRSFRRTRRRDYIRPLEMPGYWSFTFQVLKLLNKNRAIFAVLIVIYGILSVLLVGVSSQDTYVQLRETLADTGNSLFTGAWGEVGKAGLLVFSGITGSFTPELSEGQQVYAGLLVLLAWLTTIWLLRAIMAGHKPRLRDGLYNAGSPIVPMALVSLLLLVQLLPLAIAVLGYSAASSSDLVSTSGFLAMIIFLTAFLLGILSLYWISATFMALIIVTLPGMYPWQAIRTAGDLVVGRRIRILLRLIWLSVSVIFLWILLVIPMILAESWLATKWSVINNLQLIPITVLAVGSISTVWSASYVYMLYRKVVEDDADPA